MGKTTTSRNIHTGILFFNSLFKFILVIKLFSGLREDEMIDEKLQTLNSLN